MIRIATTEDLPKLGNIAKEFYSSSEHLDGFDIDIFVSKWQIFIDSGMGVIFLLLDDNNIIGVLGGMKYPDINSDKLIATELFWYVEKEHRGQGGDLLSEFEKWAKNEGCEKITMVHLSDSMPDKLEVIYKRRGYKKIEVHYVKEVS